MKLILKNKLRKICTDSTIDIQITFIPHRRYMKYFIHQFLETHQKTSATKKKFDFHVSSEKKNTFIPTGRLSQGHTQKLD